MNFLGHLFFSNNDPELMYANLFGDTVKGKKYLDYPEEIQKGILLHRKIDEFIDRHTEVMNLKRELYKELPKVSSVAIDLYFDHLLALNWKDYHSISYPIFLEQFYTYQPKNWHFYPPSFRSFITHMRDRQWLNYYPYQEGLIKSCQGVSSRISFPNKLNQAPTSYHRHQEIILKTFRSFMEDAKVYITNCI
jgi:acyl carrier protein phosphodiesterase